MDGSDTGLPPPSNRTGRCIVCKYPLCLVNVFLSVVGACVAISGAWLTFDGESLLGYVRTTTEIREMLQTHRLTRIAGSSLIMVGSVMMFASLIGSYGAYAQNRALLGFYIAFMALVVIGQMSGAAYAFVRLPLIKEAVSSVVVGALRDQYPAKANKFITDELMETLKCCGWNDYRDFAASKFAATTNFPVPRSCCVRAAIEENYQQCIREALEPNLKLSSDHLFIVGCKMVIVSYLKQVSDALFYGAVAVALTESVVLLAAVWLYKSLPSSGGGGGGGGAGGVEPELQQPAAAALSPPKLLDDDQRSQASLVLSGASRRTPTMRATE